ncbi:MAG: tRNA pseudouridine(38-40) synthase TruA [Chloroflexota bacterium]
MKDEFILHSSAFILSMARYQLILAYDGTNLKGSQRQAKKRTAQGELEKALRTLGWTGGSVLIAGRTDSGVHAEGQSVALDLEWAHGPEALRDALNANLPPDLAVREAREVSPDFHPRFDAAFRRYRYRLFCDPIRDPLRERFAWRVWPAVNVEALNQVAPIFLGKRDFAAFGSPPKPSTSTVRTITLARWTQTRSESAIRFEVQADAFLYRMARRLVFVQVAVAQGRLSIESVREAVERQVPLIAGLAPPNGLSLVEVTYADQSKNVNRKS